MSTHASPATRVAGSLLMVLLAACSKDKAIDEPAKLTPFAATLRVEHLWGASVDDKQGRAAASGTRPWRWSTTASTPPATRATWWPSTCNTGKVQWRTRTKAPLSGGTAAGADAGGGRHQSTDACSRSTRPTARSAGRCASTARCSPRRRSPRSSSRCARSMASCAASRPADGHELWVQEQQVPRLSLRGTARPVIAGDAVLCGFDNGKVDGGEQPTTARCSGRRP